MAAAALSAAQLVSTAASSTQGVASPSQVTIILPQTLAFKLVLLNGLGFIFEPVSEAEGGRCSLLSGPGQTTVRQPAPGV